MDLLTTGMIIVACLLFEAFFSGSEIGVVSADQMKLRHDAAKGSAGAKLALKMLEKPEWLLSTTLVGTNIAVVTNTTMTTALMMHLLGEQGQWLAIVVAAPLIWVFGEIVPKSVFQQRADAITPRAIFFLKFAAWLFYPILIVFSFLTRGMARMVGGAEANPFTLREEIITMLQMPAKEGGVRPEETEMIRRLFSFSESKVREIMVPLVDVAAVEQGMTRGEAMRVAALHKHVRLPVYEERVDRVVGMLHVLDLLGLDRDEPVSAHVREVRYVPAAKSSKELLLELRSQGEMLAVVVDEFGGAEGIVTIEDIMEEVVEEIDDEYDDMPTTTRRIRKVADRTYLMSGRTEIAALEEHLDISLPSGGYATVAGFLLAKAGDVPPPGTMIEAEGVTFTVKRSSPQTIDEVQVRV